MYISFSSQFLYLLVKQTLIDARPIHVKMAEPVTMALIPSPAPVQLGTVEHSVKQVV